MCLARQGRSHRSVYVPLPINSLTYRPTAHAADATDRPCSQRAPTSRGKSDDSGDLAGVERLC